MLLIRAFYIMLKAHWKQRDKRGNWYIFHPIRVMLNTKGYKAKIVALLHGVIEDSDITLEDLSMYFEDDILESIDLLTKRRSQLYSIYLENIKKNEIARLVKISDLKDNFKMRRLKNPTLEDYAWIDKRTKSLEFLKSR